MVGLGLLWIEDYTTQTTEENTEGASQLPDYYGKGLKNRTYAKTGTLQNQFEAQSSTHYPAKRYTSLTLPKVTTLADDGEEWVIQSLTGTHFEDEQSIVLEQQVLISPSASASLSSGLSNNQETAIIRTSKLTLFTETKIAETDQPVEVISSNGHIDAIGMIIKIDQQRVEFLSQVKARYAP
jgi:LPS export ABC transporter protein LptC